MAKPHGSVRIGPISLFALIIILCLAVLAVLSLSTSIAELRISERQAQTTTETYQLETVGQTFTAEVDEALVDGMLDEVLPLWGVAVTAAATEDVATNDATATTDTATEDGVPAGESDATADKPDAAADKPDAAADEPAGEAIEDEGFGALPDESFSVVRDSLVTCTGTFDGTLITATFSLESGRQLACVLRINDDATYTIEEWKVTTQWLDDGTGETLWLG